MLFESQSGQLVNNLSLSSEHAARFENLRPATLYSAVVYAVNEQGKSTPLRLQTATLGPPEKRQMSQSMFTVILRFECIFVVIGMIFITFSVNEETPEVNQQLLLVIGVLAVISVVFTIILVVIKSNSCRKRRRKPSKPNKNCMLFIIKIESRFLNVEFLTILTTF